ncbi:MAG: hypothetical protein RLZZ502_1684, partial [Pseudomonadota bacterium]
MNTLIRIVEIIGPVLAIIMVGTVFGRVFKPDMKWVNRLALDVLGPMLVFSALASKEFDIYANANLIIASVTIVAVSGLIAWPFVRMLGEDPRTFVPP